MSQLFLLCMPRLSGYDHVFISMNSVTVSQLRGQKYFSFCRQLILMSATVEICIGMRKKDQIRSWKLKVRVIDV